jgi:hypothetical protein
MSVGSSVSVSFAAAGSAIRIERQLEVAPVAADAALAEQDRAGRAEPDGGGDDQHHRRQDQEHQAGSDAVERMLHGERVTLRVGGLV